MILFLIVVALLLGASLGLLFYPWSSQDDVDHNTLSGALYQARRQEIEQDDHPDGEAMVAELQRTLLSDIPTTTPPVTHAERRGVLLPGALALIVISTVVFLKTTDIGAVLELRLAQDELPELMSRAVDPARRPLRQDEVEQLGLGLRSYVQVSPHETGAWRLLGLVGNALNNDDMAMQAFARASQLEPENPVIALDYAGAMICSDDENTRRQGEDKLHELLKANPERLREAARRESQSLNLLVKHTRYCDVVEQYLLKTGINGDK